ncbi:MULTISPECIES: hypothetical protein [unclassified Pseudomonas]|uniref:hypothetical protein n=1 Tax=unclassified Pseudomonas TaxID=196821 RepID=UPI00071F5A4F|nr:MULTISPECIES: hypothetical protein [unclassified Pseudomonas]OOG14640.1 hypothetical protein BMS17_21895 [Pseudomonas sp. C9]CRL51606.1 hypothetical protein PSHI_47990 [Pseudomonas sp. URMO17WK12:I11]
MNFPPSLDPPNKKCYYGKHAVYFPSRKNQHQLICDSMLEADYCVLLEYDSTVVNYWRTPGVFDLSIEQKVIHYTPDFLIETLDQFYYTEVKVDFKQLSPLTLAKLHAANTLFNESDRSLRYADEKNIREGELLRNIKHLYLHSFNVSDDEFGDCLRQIKALTGSVCLGDFMAGTHGPSARSVYKAMFDRILKFDLSSRLTFATKLEVERDDHHA